MEQTLVLGCNYGVAEGEFPNDEGNLEPRKVLVFVDPKTDKQYHFPLTLEQVDDVVAKLKGEASPVVTSQAPPPEPDKAERARLQAIERATQGGPLVGGKR